MTWLSDRVVRHLCEVADWPDLTGTRYELVEKIGQGGMGTVYHAEDRALQRPVALKVLSDTADQPQARARMEREARITARLEHPSIVPVHDSGVLPDGRFYYAMKLVRGRRLDDREAVPEGMANRLQLFQKICDAIAFAHAHGILHRDLKPQNIMLGAFGEVLVLDWGIASELGEAAPTAPGTVAGTPGYMSPEQARGEVGAIDRRADVYALGGILYFLLTGAAPGPERHSPRRHDRSIGRPLEAICEKALAGDRERRYADAAELGADIGAFLAGRRVAAYPEGVLQTSLRLAMKYRAVVALILAYLVMRILLLLFAGP